MYFEQIGSKVKPKSLFLLDSCGAIVSALLLGIILVRFESTFGMPINILYFLSFLACIFALYSFLCFLFTQKNSRLYLKIIAMVNLAYCCLTIGLVIYFYHRLTFLGLLYFFVEIIIITLLSILELKTASKSDINKT